MVNMGLGGDSEAHISRVDFPPSYLPLQGRFPRAASTSPLNEFGCAHGGVARREINPRDVCRGIPAEAHFFRFKEFAKSLRIFLSDFANCLEWRRRASARIPRHTSPSSLALGLVRSIDSVDSVHSVRASRHPD